MNFCSTPSLCLYTCPRRLWLQSPAASGGAPTRQQLQRVVVQRGRLLKPRSKSTPEVWGVQFEGVASREQVRLWGLLVLGGGGMANGAGDRPG